MMYNIYYDPEKFGLDTIGTIDVSSGSYEFDYIVVWQKGNELFYASDSGCSCPMPFESFGVNDLTKINSTGEFAAYLETAKDNGYNYEYESNRIDQDCAALCQKVADWFHQSSSKRQPDQDSTA